MLRRGVRMRLFASAKKVIDGAKSALVASNSKVSGTKDCSLKRSFSAAS